MSTERSVNGSLNRTQRRLEEWSVWQRPDSTMFLIGRVFGDERFDDSELIRTSDVQLFSFKERTARTMNSVYQLGQSSQKPEAELACNLLQFGLSSDLPRVQLQLGGGIG